MALLIKNYEMPDKSILSDAYIRIQSIVTENEDCEFLEPFGDDLKTSWVTQLKNRANVYVWADQLCRENRVSPLHWFSFEFRYDLRDVDNIYQQAYSELKSVLESKYQVSDITL